MKKERKAENDHKKRAKVQRGERRDAYANPSLFALSLSALQLCGWWDSNPHTLRLTPLKRACLPISPHPQFYLQGLQR
jgi:hypothetical protein